jgi:Carboxypeptidase regulatory-like domain
MTRVTGRVIVATGQPTSTVQVRLMNLAENVPGVGAPSTLAGRDGTFAFSMVPPGQYRLVASASVGGRMPPPIPAGQNFVVVQSGSPERLWAVSDIVVDGSSPVDVTLTLAPGMTISGGVTFEGTTMPPPTTQSLRRVRLTLSLAGPDAAAAGSAPSSTVVDANGQFTLAGVVPGTYRLRISGVSGWSARSAIVGARELLDFPLEMLPGQDVSGVRIVFVETLAEIGGRLEDATGQPTADYVVVLFPADKRYWLPQARRIRATTTTTGGQFTFGALPAGDYRLAAVTDVEEGAWYGPAFLQAVQAASLPVSVRDGERKTQNLRVAGR